MFKFMKSKKGFSLVELMIVVVIMAILVAVAVPIFNSVTGNARAKTCIDNQRQIVSNVGNLYLVQGISGTGGPVTLTVTKASGITTADADALSTFSGGKVTLTDIQGAFQTDPVCGDDANTIEITITANTDGGTAKVTTECNSTDDDNPHVLDTND